jgi:hypothetical protein
MAVQGRIPAGWDIGPSANARFVKSMIAKLTWCLILTVAAALPAFAERVVLVDSGPEVKIAVKEASDTRTVIRLEINAFTTTPVDIGGQRYYTVSIEGEGVLLNEGEPALPRVCRSIVIPDAARVEARIISSSYTDFPETPIAPSKGNLSRAVNPRDVPFSFGPTYTQDQWYPAGLVEAREPFILRDYRGTVIECHPFQYHPLTRTLRVFTSLTIEIATVGPDDRNILARSKRAESIVRDFEMLYQRRFLNYDWNRAKYNPVAEAGDMLIITYDSFHTAMEPFVAWKRQKGIRTWLVDISTIGNNSSAITNYIRSYYEADSVSLAYVLLVGDVVQIARPAGVDHSDPVYALVAGDDHYPDIIIGRFSAQTVGQVETQVERTIMYETDPPVGDWLGRGCGIASGDSEIGQGGEFDWEHIDRVRSDLLAFTYTDVDRIYEIYNPTAAEVTAAVNDGRSFINYCGHGSTTAWGTTAFTIDSVNNLVNNRRLPFIFSVACQNGYLDRSVCFAEAWLRATHDGVPSGAVAMYASYRIQDWSPPMDAQDEAVDLLVSGQAATFGSICFNGACRMIEINDTEGADEYDAWTVFGDPSLLVRTAPPTAPAVYHPDVIIEGVPSFGVEVAGVPGALCALSADTMLCGSTFTDETGKASIPLSMAPAVGQDLVLTVTAFNKTVYVTTLPVVSATGPYLILNRNVIDDTTGGDGNGMIDAGEQVRLGIEISNIGIDAAFAVEAILSTDDTLITVIDSSTVFDTIPGDNGRISMANAFGFDVSPSVPDGHLAALELTMTDTIGNTWSSRFAFILHAPVIICAGETVDDAAEDGSGTLDPGETADLIVTLRNEGTGGGGGVSGLLSSADPYVNILDPAGSFDPLPASGGLADNQTDPFVLSVEASCPPGHQIDFSLAVLTAAGCTVTLPCSLLVGKPVTVFFDDFFLDQGWSGRGGSGEWSIGPATGGQGFDAAGGPDPAEDYSPSADNYLLGTDLLPGAGGDYDGDLDTTYWISSPVVDCSRLTGVHLSFRRWLGVDVDVRDKASLQAYDGAEWITIFDNTMSVRDSSWTHQIYDVSPAADGNAAFQIRFGIGPTNGFDQYCGWNIDDVTLWGFGTPPFSVITLNPQFISDTLTAGDTLQTVISVHNTDVDSPLLIRPASQAPWLRCDTVQQTIGPLDSLPIVIAVAPPSEETGEYTGVITVTSTDLTQPYDTIVFRISVCNPRMEVSATMMLDTITAGTVRTVPLTISNTGGGRLDYQVSTTVFGEFGKVGASGGDPVIYEGSHSHTSPVEAVRLSQWLSVTPALGSVPPLSSIELTMSFDAGDLGVGMSMGQMTVVTNDPVLPTLTIPVSLTVLPYLCGDANSDGRVDVGDAVSLMNYIFRGGRPPEPIACGDVNSDGAADIGDAVFLVNYIFKEGPPPACPSRQ